MQESTQTERALMEIWCSVLKTERIGPYDNFLDLGGHSLLATLCINRIKELWSVELPLEDFLSERAHIAALAAEIDRMRSAVTPATATTSA